MTNTPKANLSHQSSYPPSKHHWEQCSELRNHRFDFGAKLHLILLLKGPRCHIGHDELHRGFGAVWPTVIWHGFTEK